MRMATWNVLHRVHAENWDEGVVTPFPDESVRVEAVAARVAELMAGGVEVVCLQEVSGDQLAALRGALPAGAEVFELTYPRRPAPRRPHVGRLRDPAEHLVTLVAADRPAKLLISQVFPDDPGKGFLGVDVAGALVVFNTHVSFGERSPGQLARLSEAARRAPKAALLGDFNAGVYQVADGLGPDFAAATLPPGALPTRPRAKAEGKHQNIDHILVRGASVTEADVRSAGGLSDHNLVVATVTP